MSKPAVILSPVAVATLVLSTYLRHQEKKIASFLNIYEGTARMSTWPQEKQSGGETVVLAP